MGKRDHGRLVHEIRDALIKHGFKPYRSTQLDTPEGLRGARSPGFKLDKHHDGKSVRLFYRMAVAPSVEAMDRNSSQAQACALMKKLVRYNATLEQEGFTCLAINSHDPLASYSLWRRANSD